MNGDNKQLPPATAAHGGRAYSRDERGQWRRDDGSLVLNNLLRAALNGTVELQAEQNETKPAETLAEVLG